MNNINDTGFRVRWNSILMSSLSYMNCGNKLIKMEKKNKHCHVFIYDLQNYKCFNSTSCVAMPFLPLNLNRMYQLFCFIVGLLEIMSKVEKKSRRSITPFFVTVSLYVYLVKDLSLYYGRRLVKCCHPNF